jgi:hypothetical protein
MRGIFKEHIVTISQSDEVVQGATSANYKGLATNFVLGNDFSTLQNNVQLPFVERNANE